MVKFDSERFFSFFFFMLRLSFRSPESVEMDEIMAAMVLTSLSGSPVVQSPPQMDPGPGQSSFTNTKLHH